MATNPGVDCVTDGLLSQQSSSNKTMDDKTVFIVALGSALFVVTLIAFILLGWVVNLKRTIREMPHVKEEVFLVPNPAFRTGQNIEISPPLPSSLSDIQSQPPNDQEQSATSNSLNSHLTDLPTRSSDSTESPNSMAAPLDDPPQRASLSLDPPDFPPEPSQSSFSLSHTTSPDKGTDPATHVPRFRKRSASLDLNSSPRVLPPEHGNFTILSIKIPTDSIPPETSTRQLGGSYSSKPRKDNSPIGVSWRDQSPIPSVELPLEDIPSALDAHTDTLPSPSAGSDCGPFRMFWRDQSPIPSVEIPLDDIPSASDTHANTLPSANAGSDSGRFRMFSRDPSPILSVVLPLDDTPPARPTHDSPMSLLAVPKRRFALPSTLSDSSPAQQHSKQTAPFTQPSYLSLTSTAQNADTDLIQDGNDQSTISSVEIPQDNISSEHSGRPSYTSLSSMERGKYENPQTSLKDRRSSEAPQERISSLKSTTNGYTHVSQASRSEYMGLHACTGIQSTITSPNYPKQEDSPPSTPSKYKSISPVAESAYSDLQASPLATAHSVPTGSRSGGISRELPRRSSYTSITLTAGGESEYTGLTEDPRAHSTKRLQGEASPSTQSNYISVPSAVDNPYTSPQRATLPTDEVQRGGISSASSTGPARSYNSRLPAPNSKYTSPCSKSS
eukprot:scpid42580/ scgid10292/ 